MDTPTRAQCTILRAIQNKSVTAGQHLEQMRLRRQMAGEVSLPLWAEQFWKRAMVGHLEDAAVAGGIPQAWIDHVIERGQRGVRWDPDHYLRVPKPINRGQILHNLSQDVQEIHDMAAVAAVYGEIGLAAEPGTASGFNRNMRSLWRRTVAVTQVLEITGPEAEQLWQTHEWVHTAASNIVTTPRTELDQRWRTGARADTKTYVLQADALRGIGITADSARHPPPTPEQMTAQVRAALAADTAQQAAEPGLNGPGADIADAIDAVVPALDQMRSVEPGGTPGGPEIGLVNESGVGP